MFYNFKVEKMSRDLFRDVVYVKVRDTANDYLIQFEVHYDHQPKEVGYTIYKTVGENVANPFNDTPIESCCPFGMDIKDVANKFAYFYSHRDVVNPSPCLIGELANSFYYRVVELADKYRIRYENKATIKICQYSNIKILLSFRTLEVEELIEEFYQPDNSAKDLGWFIFNNFHPTIDITQFSTGFKAHINGEKQANWLSITKSLKRFLGIPTDKSWEKNVIRFILTKFQTPNLPKNVVDMLKTLNATDAQIKTIAKELESYTKTLK